MIKAAFFILVFSFFQTPTVWAKRRPAKKETLVGKWDIPAGDGSPQGVAELGSDRSYTLTLHQQDGSKRIVKGKYRLVKPYTIFFKDLEGFGADCRGEGSYDYAQRGDTVFFTLQNDRCVERIRLLKTTWKKQRDVAQG